MKKSLLLITIVLGLINLSFSQTHSISKAPAGTVYNQPTGYVPSLHSSSEFLVTYSSNQAITPGNSVACIYSGSGLHSDNSYFRVFDLPNSFGVYNGFVLQRLEIGVESADGATGSQPIVARFYTLQGSLSLANLTLIGSQNVTIPDQSLSIFNIVLTTPVLVPKGKRLVVEIFTPDGDAAGNRFFIGSNATATSSPTYISATGCGISEPTTFASIGFPATNMVMNLYGSNNPVPIPFGAIAVVFMLIALTTIVVTRKRMF